MNDIITIDDPLIKNLFDNLTHLESNIHDALANYRPVMGGEIYLTNDDVCSILHVSQRTLQEYRSSGLISFIQLPGKIIYKESDLFKVLEDNYSKKFM